MPKQIKEAKNIEVLVNITYENNDNTISQIFSFVVSNKRYLSYLQDARFSFKKKLEKLISSMLLDGFQRREDCEDKITMFYSKQDLPKPCIRKIQFYVPPYLGCNFCSLAKIEGQFVFCPEKNKHYVGGVKRCPIFRSKDELIT